MATVVELEVSADRLGGARAFEQVQELELRVDGLIGDAPPLVWVSGADRTTIESALEADPSLEVIAALSGTEASTDDGRYWPFRVDFDQDLKLFEQIVAETGGAILTASAIGGAWSLELLFHERSAASEAYSVLESYDFGVTVVRMTSLDGTGGVRSRLTEAQYETVVAAYELGYFDVPRQVTLRELAAELDVSHQALSERLRRGQAALVSQELLDQAEPTVGGS